MELPKQSERKIKGYSLDTQDNLPVEKVGEWAKEKHDLLRFYVGISSGVRKNFNTRSQASYIDLFSGPGRSIVKETKEIIDGGAIVAARESIDRFKDAHFSTYHIADVEASLVEACESRLRLLTESSNVKSYKGPAASTVKQICRELNPYGLHFAFLDPYNLGELDFSIIKSLAGFTRMDMIIHVSVMDLNRNLGIYLSEKSDELDRFAPGWRNAVDTNTSNGNIRHQIYEYWISLIKGLGLNSSTPGTEVLIRNNKQAPLYWLVFIAKHDLARRFWQEVHRIDGQKSLF